jgi:hypothetical protein
VGLLGDIVDAVEDAADTVGDAIEDAVEDAVDAVEDAAEAVFACAYGVGYADAGFSYEENPLEAEAFAVQGAYLAAGRPAT